MSKKFVKMVGFFEDKILEKLVGFVSLIGGGWFDQKIYFDSGFSYDGYKCKKYNNMCEYLLIF